MQQKSSYSLMFAIILLSSAFILVFFKYELSKTGGAIDYSSGESTISGCEEGYASSISQYGITWFFDKCYRVGQFVNGDYWVLGPVTVDSISVPSGTEQPRCGSDARSGSTVNPRFGKIGYDARIGLIWYDPALCRLAPIALAPGDSLLSVASKLDTNDIQKTKTATILTVVDIPQSPDRFRPPFTRSFRVPKSADDPLSFSINQIQWNLLPSLPPVAATPPMDQTTAFFAKAWMANCQPWTCRYVAPSDNMPGYGREFGDLTSEGSLQLLLNYSNDQKKPLLTGFVQLGIDYYGALLDGGEWHADAGIFQGRKSPILFAGILLNDSGMKNIGTTHLTFVNDFGQQRFRFAEDGQTYYFDDPALPAYVDRVTRQECFQPGGTCMQARGVKGWVDKYNGGPGDTVLWRITEGENWGIIPLHEHLQIADWSPECGQSCSVDAETYRRCCSSRSFVGYALATQILGAQSLWNHDAFFDYVYRWMIEDDTEFQKKFFERFEYSMGFKQGFADDDFVNNMWVAYYGMGGGNPFAIFAAEPLDGAVPLLVHFDASNSHSPNGQIVQFDWSFGDNQFGSGPIIDHTFTQEGVFMVRLTVTDSIGKKASSLKKITVTKLLDVGLLFFLPLDGSKEDASVKKRTINCGSTGCPDFVAGHKGQAIESDGTANGKYLWVPDASDLTGMSQISFAFWAKKTDSTGGTVFTRIGAYQFDIGNNYVKTFLNFQDRSESNIRQTTETINNTEWHHYALTFDGIMVKVFVDGTEIASDASASGKNISTNWPNYAVFIIKPFKGQLDELRMYKRGLSLNEIKALAEKPSTIALG